MKYKFTFDIEPIQQMRPRIRRLAKGATMYDPKVVKRYKLSLGALARKQMEDNGWKTLEGNSLKLKVVFYRPIQKSISKVERQRRIDNVSKPIVKPDNSNYLKAFEDALNGIVWKDDSLITDIYSKKRYSDVPRIEMEVEEI